MSGSIPFLGSKISLISKSEIRYEGILYTIDAQDSIIALAKVRSFGTEDRPTEMPVPARDEVYEYIIFRGTDIKKIEVCDKSQSNLPGSLHNDPAIVQHSAAPGSFQAAPHSRSLGPVGGALGGMSGVSYNNMYMSMSQQGLPNSGAFPLAGSSQASEGGGSSGGTLDIRGSPGGHPPPIGAPPSHQSRSQSDLIVGSRSSTPTARKSPVSDAGVQVSPQISKDEKKRSPKQPERNREQREPQQAPGNRRQNFPNQGHHPHPHQHQQGHSNNPNHSNHQNQSRQYSQSNNQDRPNYQNYNNNYGGFQAYRGRGRPSRRSTQSRRGGQGYGGQNRQRQMQDEALFAKEFDFEKANEDFEELMSKLTKAKISENGDSKNGEAKEEIKTEEVKNGDSKKEDSGVETASAGESSEHADDESSTCYDRSKSFFDSISCEAVERSKGKSQRPDWRQERKTNVETFGVSSTRQRSYYPRGRGGYRGGGYYRNYNGGYYNNYNYNNYRGGGGNYRGRGGSRGGNSGGNVNRMNGESSGPTSYSQAIRNSSPVKN